MRAVTLQLKWKHQFQFAGYYMAEAKGYYREAGLTVAMVEADSRHDPVSEVLKGRAEFGTGTTDLVLQRAQGKPVVVLSVLMQHSPLAIMALARSGIEHVHGLAGKRLMLERDAAELLAYLKREGLTPPHITLIPTSFEVDDLFSGRVEAQAIYSTDEPFEARRRGIEYFLFSPRAEGIDFYGDNLFTRQDLLQKEPELVKAFVAASMKGWRYALEHPDEAINLIYHQYSQRKSLDALRYEADEMRKLMMPELVEVGYMSPSRWLHIASVYRELGLIGAEPDMEGFLYSANVPRVPAPPDRWLLGGSVLGLTLLLLAWLGWRWRRRVKRLEAALLLAQCHQTDIVIYDGLTELFNERFLGQMLPRELIRMGRRGLPYSVLRIELDNLTAVIERQGRLRADSLLQNLADYLRDGCRRGDVVCLLEDGSFIVCMPDTSRPEAQAKAEDLRRRISATSALQAGFVVPTTVSIGVASFPADALQASYLLAMAGHALTKAKAAGKDQVAVAD
ncbi:GGDEF domain-containing protein [Parachitinimonas caeni]|uniref:Thiamine pyrimidine synthase n=1 Tax=Parachitinimonas caeni TaxID=3031301 RepID=A0ABT7E7T6_9NEIS|nr:GGDEF domain-containing protein [Parachitinimonas caeni]MDK2126972.1 ABC transporter substrate-binding protein [Parachitinimonas caeni]